MLSIVVVGDRTDAQRELPDNPSRDKLQEIFERQRQYTANHEIGSYSHVLSCSGVDSLVGSIVKIVRSCHETVDVLDIFDHARPGLVLLGKDTLFEFKELRLDGVEIMEVLSLLVSFGGSVRLLGCNTALEDDGRCLLTRAAAASDFSLRVYGTIDRIGPAEFRKPGFSGSTDLLFSSEAAIDRAAPSSEERRVNLARAYGADTAQRKPISNQIAASGRAFRHVISSE
jgi:hypothetical protein